MLLTNETGDALDNVSNFNFYTNSIDNAENMVVYYKILYVLGV